MPLLMALVGRWEQREATNVRPIHPTSCSTIILQPQPQLPHQSQLRHILCVATSLALVVLTFLLIFEHSIDALPVQRNKK